MQDHSSAELTEQYPSDFPSSTFLAILESGFEIFLALTGVSDVETSPSTVMTNDGSMLLGLGFAMNVCAG
jgi:hypothetical protein